MITVKDYKTDEEYRGRSPQTIARRLYGPRVVVRRDTDPRKRGWAWVLYPKKPEPWDDPSTKAWHPLAAWTLDDEALAAMEAEDRRR
jgi:hypothetical protein